MITGIDHIELIVRDVDEFIRFFELMGWEVVKRTRHHRQSAELKRPGDDQPIFEIHELGVEEVPGINHIAFRTGDIQTTYQKLVEGGVRFSGPPHPIRETGRLIANFRDPDGWRLQLVDARREQPT